MKRALSPLAQRLRELRQQASTTAGRPLKQKDVAAALSVSTTIVCLWETAAAVPTDERINDYANLLATVRADNFKLPSKNELTRDEQQRQEELASELRSLHDDLEIQSASTAASTPKQLSRWHYPGEEPVRIVCGALQNPPQEANPAHVNHVKLLAYADLDALDELKTHLRNRNQGPTLRSSLRRRLPTLTCKHTWCC